MKIDSHQQHGDAVSGVRCFSELVTYWKNRTPDAVALVEGAREMSYAMLDAEVDRVARALAEAGLRAHDRIMIVAENSLSAVVLATAANRLRACCSILNARMKASEIRPLAAFAEPRMIVFPLVDPDVSMAAARLADEFEAETLITSPVFGEIRACPVQMADPNPPEDDLGLIMFTSGTTGMPKGVMLTNATLLEQARAQCISRALTPEDSIYLVSPIAHAIGFSSNILAAMACGGRVILAPRFQVAELVERIAAGDVTMMVSVPQLFNRMIEHITTQRIDLSRSRLRVTSSGGASLDPDLKARAGRVLGTVLYNGYGATECVPITRVPIGADVAGNVVGRASPGIELRIVDAAGQPLPDGEDGEIWARGPFAMKGYFRNPEETAKVILPGGWVATGDLGRIGPDGMLAIVGRKKEIIIRSGFNVYPIDVEAALCDHADVAEAAVVGRAVPGNEEVVAFVTATPGRRIDIEALMAHLRATLTAYKVPSEVFVIDMMPIGPTGKIQKALLKDRL